MKVITISGQAMHGKDTAANIMADILRNEGNKVLITHYADLLKYICKTFFEWDGKKDEKGRTLLQKVGTNVIRKEAPDYWVKFIADILSFFKDQWDYVIISDARFPNEIEYLKKRGHEVYHVNVIRPSFESVLTESQKNHPSETALRDTTPDYVLLNTTICELAEDVKRVVNEIKNKRSDLSITDGFPYTEGA